MAYTLRIHSYVAAATLPFVFAGACRKKPSVMDIEIVPSKVIVGSDLTTPTTFELEARLWTGTAADRWSITESDGYDNLDWKSSQPWLKVISPNRFHAVLRIEPGAAPTGSAFVTVKAGGKKTVPGAEIVVAPSGIAVQDIVTANYAPAKPPDVVVANGIISTGGPCTEKLAAFVRRSILGNMLRPCQGDDAGWGAAVLATDHAGLFMPVGWTPTQDVPNAGAAQSSLRALPVALRIMIATNSLGGSNLATLQNEALAIAQADLKVANSILAENRSGIELTLKDTKTIDVFTPTVVGDCPSGDALTSGSDFLGVLNVYYVNKVGIRRGVTCDRLDGRNRDVIYVAWEENPHSTTTLVHEIGHALGLMMPGAGHSDMTAGLDGTNVMATGDDDRDPGGRRRFTVGQAFRLNADSASWLNLAMDPNNPAQPIRETSAARLPCQCGEADPTGRCPRVVDDIARPSQAPSSATARHCFDDVQVVPILGPGDPPVPSDEKPVAIAAGRRWRAPPGNCTSDLPGPAEARFGATYVRLENLTRPGGCKSWAAIFFRHGRVVHQPLAEPGFTWTPTADVLAVKYDVTAPIEVKVHVHSPPADAQQDRDHALETFGPQNRSGILLDFQTGGSCPLTNASPDIHLCYVTMASEGSVSPDGIVKVSLNNRKATTVSHFIGRALGLNPTTDQKFGANIMRSTPADRGQKLTLGQVFRISVRRNSALPPCNLGTCPSLGADVPP